MPKSIFENKIWFSGGDSDGATPVPIPNTEVKPISADGTAEVTLWESRTSPGLKYEKTGSFIGAGLFALMLIFGVSFFGIIL